MNNMKSLKSSWVVAASTVEQLRSLISHTAMNELYVNQEKRHLKFLEESKEFLIAYKSFCELDEISWDKSKHVIDNLSEELGDVLIMIMLKVISESNLDVHVNWETSDLWTIYNRSTSGLYRYLKRHANLHKHLDMFKAICLPSFVKSVYKALIRHTVCEE